MPNHQADGRVIIGQQDDGALFFLSDMASDCRRCAENLPKTGGFYLQSPLFIASETGESD
jgi:hypothetical protein